MYINDLHILTYVVGGILGLFIGQFIDWCNIRLEEYKNVFSKEFFTVYLKNAKPKYILMIIVAILYIALLYLNGLTIETIKFIFLIPMLLMAFIIDYKLQIIPNRLTLTIFEFGLIFTFAETLLNTNVGINIFINNLLGMIAGGGIFLLITLIGGLLAGKEAMGFRRCKIDGSIRAFLWMA